MKELLKAIISQDWTEEITILGLVVLGIVIYKEKPEVALAVATGLIGYLKREKKANNGGL